MTLKQKRTARVVIPSGSSVPNSSKSKTSRGLTNGTANAGPPKSKLRRLALNLATDDSKKLLLPKSNPRRTPTLPTIKMREVGS